MRRLHPPPKRYSNLCVVTVAVAVARKFEIAPKMFVGALLPPVRVYALVEYEGIQTKFTPNIGLDKDSTINVHFHKRRLTEDQDLFVREGDFVLYGDIYYEIVTLAEPKQMFGQIDHKIEIIARCIRAREGLFDGT